VIDVNAWSLDEKCAIRPAQTLVPKRIDNGLVLKALGENVVCWSGWTLGYCCCSAHTSLCAFSHPADPRISRREYWLRPTLTSTRKVATLGAIREDQKI